LGVSSINIADKDAHINGWDDAAGDWIYNEAKFQQMDMVMDVARQYATHGWTTYIFRWRATEFQVEYCFLTVDGERRLSFP